jgi:hypothetical protein
MHRAKGPTARWANKLLGRVGKPFWQEEYFDRLVRLELNPVKAGLVAHHAAGEKAGLKTRADLSPPSADH